MSARCDRLKRMLLTMRRSSAGGNLKPHKPVLLLAVLDLYDAGELRENRVPYGPSLMERFGDYFHAVAEERDWCQPAPPFFHLRSEGFWKHKVIAGREEHYACLQSSGGGSKRILENIEYAYLDDDAFAVVSDARERRALQRFIIQTFFTPEEQAALWKVVRSGARIAGHQALLEEGAPYVAGRVGPKLRDAAFGRMIRRIYDYQCAMCGLRIVGPDGSTPIDAAHLVPWSETHDDSPTNGIALCKLHHWALDAGLVAPSLQHKWVVSPLLDRRRNSERELTRFHRSRILLPADEKYCPRPEAILWRFERLCR